MDTLNSYKNISFIPLFCICNPFNIERTGTVYQINCLDHSSTYIGETSQNLMKRQKQHKINSKIRCQCVYIINDKRSNYS